MDCKYPYCDCDSTGGFDKKNCKAVSASDSNELLTDLRAAVALACNVLERSDRPTSKEVAKELADKFGAVNEYFGS